MQHHTAGINQSNTAVRAVLKQPCLTDGWTGTVRPKHLPAGQTGLSDQFLGPVAQDQPGPVGQICPTSWLSLWSDSARPTTGQTRQFERCSNSRVRPVNAGSASLVDGGGAVVDDDSVVEDQVGVTVVLDLQGKAEEVEEEDWVLGLVELGCAIVVNLFGIASRK
ncbi:hypothetical protein PCANC_19854 [Puccinia coronata f. sp. avenae]|uniref:Uncharacterized protein n=1 Tax=Puccinia coronata f. sp. avenae TaxID=200324 RepID=A0A2N5UC66_9BASI|nr:hypothetical protein PCANC_19854 [Puccinia coronata f. sp. avenae]